jgi:hypothetical protein
MVLPRAKQVPDVGAIKLSIAGSLKHVRQFWTAAVLPPLSVQVPSDAQQPWLGSDTHSMQSKSGFMFASLNVMPASHTLVSQLASAQVLKAPYRLLLSHPGAMAVVKQVLQSVSATQALNDGQQLLVRHASSPAEGLKRPLLQIPPPIMVPVDEAVVVLGPVPPVPTRPVPLEVASKPLPVPPWPPVPPAPTPRVTSLPLLARSVSAPAAHPQLTARPTRNIELFMDIALRNRRASRKRADFGQLPPRLCPIRLSAPIECAPRCTGVWKRSWKTNVCFLC